jgi:hypothetical protein
MAEESGSIPGRNMRFLFSPESQVPTQPSVQWIPLVHYTKENRPGREADHSSCNAEVNDGTIPPFPNVFMAW